MSERTADVVDDVEHDRFLHTEDSLEAQLVYRAEGGRLVLAHTEVPDALGGRGLGGQLVQAAVDRARRTGETLLPSCPYARKWLQDHPDVTTGITIDWAR